MKSHRVRAECNVPKPTKIKNKNGSTSYRIFVSNTITGKRESKTFTRRALADKRRGEIEREAVHGASNDFLIRDVIALYQEQFSNNYGRSKNYGIARLLNYDIADLMVSKLAARHIINHCIERNKEAKPQTVKNDVIWLRTILKTMSAVLGFSYPATAFDESDVVLKSEGLIAADKRDRLPTKGELFKLSRYFWTQKRHYLHIIWLRYRLQMSCGTVLQQPVSFLR